MYLMHYIILKSNLYFYIAPRLHFYSPEFRFFQNSSSNTLHQSGGMTSTTTTPQPERRIANSDECNDSQLASPMSHHNLMNPNSFPHLYQPDKQQKQEETHRNDALVTLMNGKKKE